MVTFIIILKAIIRVTPETVEHSTEIMDDMSMTKRRDSQSLSPQFLPFCFHFLSFLER